MCCEKLRVRAAWGVEQYEYVWMDGRGWEAEEQKMSPDPDQICDSRAAICWEQLQAKLDSRFAMSWLASFPLSPQEQIAVSKVWVRGSLRLRLLSQQPCHTVHPSFPQHQQQRYPPIPPVSKRAQNRANGAQAQPMIGLAGAPPAARGTAHHAWDDCHLWAVETDGSWID